jgi:tRNA U38,U39,U40 pseudouridine synthase TruA
LKAESDVYDVEEALEADAQVMTADEAHWLLSLIVRSGRSDVNVRALLEFISADASAVDPSIKSLIDELNCRAPQYEHSAA